MWRRRCAPTIRVSMWTNYLPMLMFLSFYVMMFLVACLLQSSAELVKEITTVEVEILRLERHLLSLYRTAFQQHLPRNNETPRGDELNRPSQKMKPETLKDYSEHQCQNSPTSSLAGPNDLVRVAIQKSSSGRVDHLILCLTSFYAY